MRLKVATAAEACDRQVKSGSEDGGSDPGHIESNWVESGRGVVACWAQALKAGRCPTPKTVGSIRNAKDLSNASISCVRRQACVASGYRA